MATITIARPSETTTGENPMFTCLSCTIAFPSAEDQRNHYRSEHHRYNMKRRVAGLPPVSLVIFDQKVADRKVETAVMSSSRGSTCEICKKTYTTENAYRSHINSKKHRDNELNAAIRLSLASSTPVQETTTTSTDQQTATDVTQTAALSHAPDVDDAAVATRADSDPDANEDEDDMNETIDAKIAAARARLSPTHCLFCSSTSSSIDDNLSHMHSAHSFFVPEADYLVDLPGLLTYLGEKIAVGNVCIYCNGKGREFRTLNAVRKHMLDKGHCKIAYDSQRDQLEISDYYDFRSSYPDAEERAAKRKARKNKAIVPEAEAEGAWEDVSDDGSEADEIVEQSGSEPEESDSEDEESDDESLPDNPITYGDTPYELVLANGSRIGHRSMKRYYAQSFSGARGRKPEDPNSGAALVRKLLADKNSALVPTKGGFGAFGAGTQVVKARNRGEAREAGRHLREFRDQTRKEQYKTRVGFQNNYQKHYRDPLLQ